MPLLNFLHSDASSLLATAFNELGSGNTIKGPSTTNTQSGNQDPLYEAYKSITDDNSLEAGNLNEDEDIAYKHLNNDEDIEDAVNFNKNGNKLNSNTEQYLDNDIEDGKLQDIDDGLDERLQDAEGNGGFAGYISNEDVEDFNEKEEELDRLNINGDEKIDFDDPNFDTDAWMDKFMKKHQNIGQNGDLEPVGEIKNADKMVSQAFKDNLELQEVGRNKSRNGINGSGTSGSGKVKILSDEDTKLIEELEQDSNNIGADQEVNLRNKTKEVFDKVTEVTSNSRFASSGDDEDLDVGVKGKQNKVNLNSNDSSTDTTDSTGKPDTSGTKFTEFNNNNSNSESKSESESEIPGNDDGSYIDNEIAKELDLSEDNDGGNNNGSEDKMVMLDDEGEPVKPVELEDLNEEFEKSSNDENYSTVKSQAKNDLPPFGLSPELFQKRVGDEDQLTYSSMEKLRKAAFEKEDIESAAQWASNLGELKKRCGTESNENIDPSNSIDSTKVTSYCRTLANESMAMAGKYYELWTDAINMFVQEQEQHHGLNSSNSKQQGLGFEEPPPRFSPRRVGDDEVDAEAERQLIQAAEQARQEVERMNSNTNSSDINDPEKNEAVLESNADGNAEDILKNAFNPANVKQASILPTWNMNFM